MNTTRKVLLTTWYQATRPYRWWFARSAAAAGRAPVMVLFYHRVADRPRNAWTISTGEFRRHIEWLRPEFDLVDLAEAQRRIREGNTRPTVSITFDDGYADNMKTALPLLIREKIPFTYFVTLRNVVTGEPFPHDTAAGAPLAPNSLEEICGLAEAGVEIGGHTRTHIDLSKVNNPEVILDEVVTATAELGQLINRPIRYFAVPYGMPPQCRPIVFDLCRQHGLAGVCSAWGDYNWPGDDAFHLRRIHGDPELIRVKNALTVDPRKCHGDRKTIASSEEIQVPSLQTAHGPAAKEGP